MSLSSVLVLLEFLERLVAGFLAFLVLLEILVLVLLAFFQRLVEFLAGFPGAARIAATAAGDVTQFVVPRALVERAGLVDDRLAWVIEDRLIELLVLFLLDILILEVLVFLLLDLLDFLQIPCAPWTP